MCVLGTGSNRSRSNNQNKPDHLKACVPLSGILLWPGAPPFGKPCGSSAKIVKDMKRGSASVQRRAAEPFGAVPVQWVRGQELRNSSALLRAGRRGPDGSRGPRCQSTQTSTRPRLGIPVIAHQNQWAEGESRAGTFGAEAGAFVRGQGMWSCVVSNAAAFPEIRGVQRSVIRDDVGGVWHMPNATHEEPALLDTQRPAFLKAEAV